MPTLPDHQASLAALGELTQALVQITEGSPASARRIAEAALGRANDLLAAGSRLEFADAGEAQRYMRSERAERYAQGGQDDGAAELLLDAVLADVDPEEVA